jgi:hypothetical protein
MCYGENGTVKFFEIWQIMYFYHFYENFYFFFILFILKFFEIFEINMQCGLISGIKTCSEAVL